MKESTLVGVSIVWWFIGNLKGEKLGEALTPLMKFIDRIGCTIRQASLLMHSEFVL